MQYCLIHVVQLGRIHRSCKQASTIRFSVGVKISYVHSHQNKLDSSREAWASVLLFLSFGKRCGNVCFVYSIRRYVELSGRKRNVLPSKMTSTPSSKCVWRWALLEGSSVVQPLKDFPAFYRTRRFITVFTRVLYWLLSCVRSIQLIPP
jgi:hypothetical protein